MTQEKTQEAQHSSPYDLWPPDTDNPDVLAAQTSTTDAVTDPFMQPSEPLDVPFEAPFIPVAYTPESSEEAVRQRGLAFSIGIVFFGSVAFMLFLGWLVDLILGTSPWGIVGGIVLGAAIGFLQFFRITSQIFKNDRDIPKENPLLSRTDDKE